MYGFIILLLSRVLTNISRELYRLLCVFLASGFCTGFLIEWVKPGYSNLIKKLGDYNWFSQTLGSTKWFALQYAKQYRKSDEVKEKSGGGLMGRIVGYIISFWVLCSVESYQYQAIATFSLAIFSLLIGCLICATAANWYFDIYGKEPRHTKELTRSDYNWINIDEIHAIFVIAFFVSIVPSVPLWLRLVCLTIGTVIFHFIDSKKTKWVKLVEDYFKEPAEQNLPADLFSSLGVMLDDTAGALQSALAPSAITAACMLIMLIL